LPPVQQGGEFDSLDASGDSETEKQPVEMSFHGAPGHFELAGNFRVVTALQQQLDNLLFAWTEPNDRLFHSNPPPRLDHYVRLWLVLRLQMWRYFQFS
jgi:hypothetical protein